MNKKRRLTLTIYLSINKTQKIIFCTLFALKINVLMLLKMDLHRHSNNNTATAEIGTWFRAKIGLQVLSLTPKSAIVPLA